MSQQYVKLVSKKDEWFKEGSEAYHYDHDRRITVEEFVEWQNAGIVLCRGQRISESDTELQPIGTEYTDGECCGLDEFDIEIVNEPK